jgi:hypothetical protein
MKDGALRPVRERVESVAKRLFQKLHGADSGSEQNFHAALTGGYARLAREWIGRDALIKRLAAKNKELRKQIRTLKGA